MANPVIANNTTPKLALEQDRKYYLCRCDRSGKQSFCDDSHQGSEFTPLAFVYEENKDYYLCRCDDGHNRFSHDQVGNPAP